MTESTLETCPKHGIQFNRAHYRECELCRGPHISTLQAESPLSPEWMQRIKLGGAVLGCALLAYVGFASMRTEPPSERVYDGAGIVGMPCVHSCADRAEECYSDCAAVRMDSCVENCMPELERCAGRCKPPLQAGAGIAVISSQHAGPELDTAMGTIFASWPVAERPSHALVRLIVDANSGSVRDAEVESKPGAQAAVVASTWKRTQLPRFPDPRDNELGRHDRRAPYVVYLAMAL